MVLHTLDVLGCSFAEDCLGQDLVAEVVDTVVLLLQNVLYLKSVCNAFVFRAGEVLGRDVYEQVVFDGECRRWSGWPLVL